MAQVTGYTAERLQDIEDHSIVDVEIVGDNLILKRHDESTINAGNVKGYSGDVDRSDLVSAMFPLTYGYLYIGQLFYDTAGSFTFTKADYPGLKAIIVECVGGGGAGGGTGATSSDQNAAGAGGSGGSYARSFILVSDLDTTEEVTVGAGGDGVTGATGGNGSDSIFDTISGEVRAAGGIGGAFSPANTRPYGLNATGGAPANTNWSTGDLCIQGQAGGRGTIASTINARGGPGGGTFYAPRAIASNANTQTGRTGSLYGGGGSGGNAAASQAEQSGGVGAHGIVIVTLLG